MVVIESATELAMTKAKKRQPKASKTERRRDDASLYPLDPETAIRAILEAGPHPKEDRAPKRRANRKQKGS
jgi:hypothetical protein